MQPKIYSFQDHLISIDKIDPKAYYIIQKLKQNHHVAYLVGGSVRDLLLKAQPKDFDISTSAKPEEIRKLFHNCILIGKRFRLAHIRFGKKIFEVSTFRSGDIEENRLILQDNIWGTEEEDVLRRDFTINGLYFDPETQSLIDYVGGFEDLKKRTLRTIGNPTLKFIQDPVRMLRLVKFRARFFFDIDPLTFKALEENRQDIVKSSQARILEELLRMLESTSAKSFFSLLYIHGLLEYLLPQIHYFFKEKKESLLLSLLETIDSMDKTFFEANHYPRSILISCLVFPLFDWYLKNEFLDTHPHFHLGMIQEEAFDLLHEIFTPFFHLPRRLKTEMISILTHQYRFTPLIKNPYRKEFYKIPRDPNFPLSLEFFKIRSQVSPDFFPAYESWQKAASHSKMKRQKMIKTHES